MKIQGMKKIVGLALLLALMLAVAAQRAQAQIIIINNDRPEPPFIMPPRPPRPFPPPRPWNPPIARAYDLREVLVSGTIRDQVAEIQVTHTIHNPNAVDLEAEYLFPLPEEGAIQSMTLMVDGKEIPGRILAKDEARNIYEEIVRRRRDPALMEYVGCGLFRTRVFPVPAGADRQVTVRYTQLCRADRHIVHFTCLSSAQSTNARPIEKLKINLRLLSQVPIKSIYSPTHEPKIERSGDHEATIALDQHDIAPEGDFRLLYTLSEGPLGVTLLSTRPDPKQDGYFFLIASPEFKPAERKPQPKTVIFVLDHSGSMAGDKIEQARNALRFVLNNLKAGDTFNIVVYNDRVETFKPDLLTFDEKNRAAAESFTRSIEAGGATNIQEALTATMKMIGGDRSRPAYVLFLTDGLPTVGEQNELKISEACRGENKAGVRLFAFGVGYDVNARLLDRLSGGNGGASEYVRPSENIEDHVARFYSRLTSPILSGIGLKASGGNPGQIYPANIPDLFEGGQLILAGRYREPGEAKLCVTGKTEGKDVAYEYPVKFAGSDEGSELNFVERLWVMRRIGFLIDQIDLNGQNKELTDELTRLSARYGILTPYTSFLADERVSVAASEANQKRAESLALDNLSLSGGMGGQVQREFKNKMMQSPAAAPMTSRAFLSESLGLNRPKSSSSGDVWTVKDSGGQPASATDINERLGNVRQVGAKTFYRKEGVWVEAELKPEDVKNAEVLEQFSESYFKLSRALKPGENQYLTFSEPLVVKLSGKIYRINNPKITN